MNILRICYIGSVTLTYLFVYMFANTARAWETEGLRVRGRMQGRWQVENDPVDTDDWSDAFVLRRARVDGRWEPQNWLQLTLELELSDEAKPRDVFARLKPHPLLQITAGQFKKPFSRLKMSSPFELSIPERGLLDRYAISDTYYGGYGGRDVGIMLSGTYECLVKLRYYLGAFNNILDDNEYHRDYVARLQVRIIKGLVLAGNVSYKRYESSDFDETTTGDGLLVGGDLSWTIERFGLQIEGAYGDNPGSDNGLADIVNLGAGNSLYGLHSTVSYRVSLGESLALTPAFMAELFDPNDQQDDDTAIRLAGALNLDIEPYVRVVLAAEGLLRRAAQFDSPTVIFLQLNLDF